MTTIPTTPNRTDEQQAKISQLIHRLRPGDRILFTVGTSDPIQQPHIVTQVAIEEDEEYRVRTRGPRSGEYFLTDEALNERGNNEGPELFIVNNEPETDNPYPFQTRGAIRDLSLVVGV
jgi:hypothetical protein